MRGIAQWRLPFLMLVFIPFLQTDRLLICAEPTAAAEISLLPPNGANSDDPVDGTNFAVIEPKKTVLDKTRARRDILMVMNRAEVDQHIPPMFCRRPMRPCDNSCPFSICCCDGSLYPEIYCGKCYDPTY